MCPQCGKSLSDKYKVRRHIEDVHTPSNHSHQCSLCHRRYKTKNTLQNHMSIYHRPRRPRHTDTQMQIPPPTQPQTHVQPALTHPPTQMHSSPPTHPPTQMPPPATQPQPQHPPTAHSPQPPTTHSHPHAHFPPPAPPLDTATPLYER